MNDAILFKTRLFVNVPTFLFSVVNLAVIFAQLFHTNTQKEGGGIFYTFDNYIQSDLSRAAQFG